MENNNGNARPRLFDGTPSGGRSPAKGAGSPAMGLRSSWRYRLGKITVSCPSCHMRRFKPYVDENGQMLSVLCGRCNRENSCGYHLTPSEYFHQHPDHLAEARSRGLVRGAVARPRPLTVREPDYIPRADVERMFGQGAPPDNFERWLCRVCGDTEAAKTVMRDYRVGRSGLFGGSPVFWQTDADMNVRTGKVMAYDFRGHRRRDLPKAVAFLHNYLGRETFDYRMVYFGTHLAARFPRAVLVLVESEKSALLLAAWLLRRGAFGVRYLPLATGSCTNLTVDPVRHASDMWYRSRVLTGRSLLLLPDSDATERWQAHVPQLLRIASGVRLIDLRPYLTFVGSDVADLLEHRLRPPR